MPELREVFEMTTKQMEPDVDAWRQQEQQQRRTSRNRKIGALAVAAVVGVAAVVLVFANRTETSGNRPAGNPSPPPVAEVSEASLVDLRTGDVTPLPESILGGVAYFTSPDRTMFAYNPPCCSRPDPAFVANVDGTGVREVTPDGVDGFGVRWSPDGSMLVYQGRDATTREIGNLFVVDVATGETTQITDLDPATYGWWHLGPTFGPDGETIVFHVPRGPEQETTRWDLWSVPVAGGEPSLLVRDASNAAYAPDGGTIAYVDAPRGYWASPRLMIADADGDDPSVLVEGDQIEYPRWSPDGTRIVYADVDGIHIVDVFSGRTSLVAEGSGTATTIADWFGDDGLVVAP
jgi:dipeptidyl aminopeptidase/acylaminoacyl peptidase